MQQNAHQAAAVASRLPRAGGPRLSASRRHRPRPRELARRLRLGGFKLRASCPRHGYMISRAFMSNELKRGLVESSALQGERPCQLGCAPYYARLNALRRRCVRARGHSSTAPCLESFGANASCGKRAKRIVCQQSCPIPCAGVS